MEKGSGHRKIHLRRFSCFVVELVLRFEGKNSIGFCFGMKLSCGGKIRVGAVLLIYVTPLLKGYCRRSDSM